MNPKKAIVLSSDDEPAPAGSKSIAKSAPKATPKPIMTRKPALAKRKILNDSESEEEGYKPQPKRRSLGGRAGKESDDEGTKSTKKGKRENDDDFDVSRLYLWVSFTHCPHSPWMSRMTMRRTISTMKTSLNKSPSQNRPQRSLLPSPRSLRQSRNRRHLRLLRRPNQRRRRRRSLSVSSVFLSMMPVRLIGYSWRAAAAARAAGPKAPGSKEIPEGAPDCLAGLTFVFTGEMESLGREDAQELVRRYSGCVSFYHNTSPSSN